MKYLALLAVLVIVYLILARQAPVNAVQEAVTEGEAVNLSQGSREQAGQGVTSLKRPFDRTHEVLEQVKARNGNGEF